MFDLPDAREVGDGARQLEHAVIGARGKVEAGERLAQQRFALRIARAKIVDFAD